jgi:hypothetical protein
MDAPHQCRGLCLLFVRAGWGEEKSKWRRCESVYLAKFDLHV